MSALAPNQEIQRESSRNSANRQAVLLFLLILSLFIFGLVLLAVVANFSIPRTKPILLGDLAAFPPAELPYELREQHAIVVNTDNQILVLSSRPPHDVFRGCPIRWDNERQLFFEPCGGATFSIEGYYLSGPSPRSMDSYPYWIEDGRILADLTQTIPGLPVGMDSGTPLPDWSGAGFTLSHEANGRAILTEEDILTLRIEMDDGAKAFRIEGWVQPKNSSEMTIPHVCRQTSKCVFQAGPFPAGEYDFYGTVWTKPGGTSTGVVKTITLFPTGK